MLARLDRAIAALCQIVSGVAFCFMVLIAFVDSIGRLINQPLLGGSEFVQYALLTFFFASLAFAVRDDSQIRIGLFADLYKPKLTRIEGLFTKIGELIALCLLTYMMYDQASRLERFGTLTSYFKVPVAPLVFLATALSLAAIWFAVRNFSRTHSDDPLPRKHAIPEEDEF